ncbi:MAG: carboxymuconolactone decarboxylase family protein [Pseudomonadota bacterium]
MQPFRLYNAENAQPPADSLLTAVEDQLGFIPNVFAVIAGSSPALKAFIELNGRFAESAFNATSREIIQIAASVENQCSYCVAGHTAFAEMQHVSTEVIDAIRSNQPIADTKLEALNQFTRSLVRNRGMISDKQVQQFLNAGYTPTHVIDVILGICVKTFSNLANNVIGIPLDDEFAEHAWQTDIHHQAA